MTTAYTVSYSVSKTFNAPMSFVYSWCIDFREDDMKMIGSKNKRSIHEKTGRRVIWTVEGKNLPTNTEPVRVVWLRPPNAWHLESCGDGSEIGDYRLTAVGKNRTRLDMTFTETHPDKTHMPSKKELEREAVDHWEKYGRFLEKDYEASLRK